MKNGSVAADWHHSFTTIDDLRSHEDYLEAQKRESEIVDEDPNVDISSLVDNQRRIFLRVVEHYRQILNQEQPPPLRVNIDGTAGTGKSYLIDTLTKALNEMA